MSDTPINDRDETLSKPISSNPESEQAAPIEKTQIEESTILHYVNELIGIVIILCTLFFAVSIFLYTPSDDSIIENISILEIFDADVAIAKDMVENPMGFFGAKISGFFIRTLLGHSTTWLLLAFGYVGMCFFRRKNFARAGYFTLQMGILSLCTSSIIGLEQPDYLLPGNIGAMFSMVLKDNIGYWGGISLATSMMVSLAYFVLLRRNSKKIKGENYEPSIIESEPMDNGVVITSTSTKKTKDDEFDNIPFTYKRTDEDPIDIKEQIPKKNKEEIHVENFKKDENVEQNIKSDFPFYDISTFKPSFEIENDEEPVVESKPLVEPIVTIEPKPSIHVADVNIEIKKEIKEKEANLDDRNIELNIPYTFPSIDLLDDIEDEPITVTTAELNENKRKLLEKLKIYGIDIVRVEATVGPRVTLFELELAPNVKVNRIVNLQNDLAMAMSARGIRILAPIPGKNAVGIEIPNLHSKIVTMKSLLNTEKFKKTKFALPIVFGRTISNEVYIDDLSKMPHLLVAGATGSGKSVGINTILTSLLYHCSPDQVKLLLIDPKRVELFPYRSLAKHFLVKFQNLTEQIITDTSKAVYALKSIEKEMDERYDLFAKEGVRNIQDYNAKHSVDFMCFIVVIIDELADMIITAGRDVEEPIARLAQLARAVGIHLIVATQRPSVNVITGTIKANFPARVAYQVASSIDSRTILDMVGAEQLLGNGDLLYLSPSLQKPIRIQNAYISTNEVEKLTHFISKQPPIGAYELPVPIMPNTSKHTGLKDEEEDASQEKDVIFNEAALIVVRHQQGSVSFLQRKLKLGFGRAARVMDQLENMGIVGHPDGSKPREVLIKSEADLENILRK